MNRRQKLRRRIWWHGEQWCDKVLDWQTTQPKGWRTSNRLLDILTPHDSQGWAATWLCRAMLAHYAIEDHCGKPEHDYCLFCRKKIPSAAAERAERLEHVRRRNAGEADETTDGPSRAQ